MVAYNFMAQFAEPVINGNKPHTVRANGKRRHAVAGELLQLYTGMRSPKCVLLREVHCIGSWLVHLPVSATYGPLIWSIGGHSMDTETMDTFARNDGFASVLHMSDWLVVTHGEDFTGTLIAWEWRPYLPALTETKSPG